MAVLEYYLVILLGLILGSFATALTYRELNDQSWSSPSRSRCPSCATKLSILDLIPIASWLMLKGKCRSCKAPIPASYPLTELTSVIACAGLYWVYGLSLQSFLMMLCVPFLIALIRVDLKRMILPNKLVLSLAILGAINLAIISVNAINPFKTLLNHTGAAILYAALALTAGLTAQKILKKPALGMGDVKLFAVSGLWLGLAPMADFYILSGATGVICAFIWQKAAENKAFPFGPAMIISLYILFLAKGSFLSHFSIQ